MSINRDSVQPPAKPQTNRYFEFLIFCGILIGAIIGVYIRIGISYYRIWRIETNNCVLYA